VMLRCLLLLSVVEIQAAEPADPVGSSLPQHGITLITTDPVSGNKRTDAACQESTGNPEAYAASFEAVNLFCGTSYDKATCTKDADEGTSSCICPGLTPEVLPGCGDSTTLWSENVVLNGPIPTKTTYDTSGGSTTTPDKSASFFLPNSGWSVQVGNGPTLCAIGDDGLNRTNSTPTTTPTPGWYLGGDESQVVFEGAFNPHHNAFRIMATIVSIATALVLCNWL
jgi:hypothetical protein